MVVVVVVVWVVDVDDDDALPSNHRSSNIDIFLEWSKVRPMSRVMWIVVMVIGIHNANDYYYYYH